MLQIYRIAVEQGLPVTGAAPIIAEGWRGRTDAREMILRGVRIEPLDEDLG